MTQEIRNDLDETENQKENTVRMAYDRTCDNLSEIVLVGATDESYKSPKTFEKAWNHENNYVRSKWSDAIEKEVENMEKNQVWRIMTKDQVPADSR